MRILRTTIFMFAVSPVMAQSPVPGILSTGLHRDEAGIRAAVIKPDKSHPIPEFPTYKYLPGPRDPFISPNATGTLVKKKAAAVVPESKDSMMSLMARLGKDIIAACKVIGVSVTNDVGAESALVQINSSKIGIETPAMSATKVLPPGIMPSKSALPPLPGSASLSLPLVAPTAKTPQSKNSDPPTPPCSVTIESGFPIKVPVDESSYITRLASRIAIESGIKLRRDKDRNVIYFPILGISDAGVELGFKGSGVPIIIPFDTDYDVSPDYDKPRSKKSRQAPSQNPADLIMPLSPTSPSFPLPQRQL